MSKSRYVTKKTKETVTKRQKLKCANNTNANIRFIGDYKCPRWLHYNGHVDQYEMDHVIEHCLGGSNNADNINLLCLDCHRKKTNNFTKYKAERTKLNTEFRILEKKLKRLDEKYYAIEEDDESSEEIDCDKMIDARYDTSSNYVDNTETMKMRLEIEKERTKRATIQHSLPCRFKCLYPHLSFEKKIVRQNNLLVESVSADLPLPTICKKIFSRIDIYDNDKDLATCVIDVFNLVNKRKFKVSNKVVYEFTRETLLYVSVHDDILTIIFDLVSEYFGHANRALYDSLKGDSNRHAMKRTLDIADKINAVSKKMRRQTSDIMRQIYVTFADKDFATSLNSDISVINYRNGKLNWTTGIFEPRDSNDCFSSFIDEDYVPGPHDTDDDEELIRGLCKNDDAMYSECLDLLTLRLCSAPTFSGYETFKYRWEDLMIDASGKKRLLRMIQPVRRSMIQLLLNHHTSS